MTKTVDPSQGMGLDPSKTTPITCDCGNQTFVHAALLRHVSAIVSPTGKEGVIPVPVLVCNACGAVPKEVIPTFLREEAAAKASGGTETPERPKLSLVP
jgi:hypothetical protein